VTRQLDHGFTVQPMELGCHRPLVHASIVALAVLSLLAAGCGGGGSPGVASVASSAVTAGPSAEGGQATGLVAYASCMRSHGVPGFPDPASGGGLPKEAVVSALQAVSNSRADVSQNACKGLLPAGGSLSGKAARPVPAQDRHDYLEAAACMRSHGFPDFPDPTFANSSVQTNIPSSINQDSSRFTSAATTCTKLIPAGLPDSGSSAP
jgi:hypothetical protein